MSKRLSLMLEAALEGQEASLASQETLLAYLELAVDIHGTTKLKNARNVIKGHRLAIAKAREVIRLTRDVAARKRGQLG